MVLAKIIKSFAPAHGVTMAQERLAIVGIQLEVGFKYVTNGNHPPEDLAHRAHNRCKLTTAAVDHLVHRIAWDRRLPRLFCRSRRRRRKRCALVGTVFRRSVIDAAAEKFPSIRKAADVVASMEGGSTLGRNVDSFLWPFGVLLCLFCHLITIFCGRRVTTAAVLSSLMKVDRRYDAHQRQVGVDRVQKSTRVILW